LAEVQCCQEDRVSGENDCRTWHIDAETQRSCSNNNAKEASSEEHLDTLAVFSIHTGVMNTYTTLQELNQTLLDTFPA